MKKSPEHLPAPHMKAKNDVKDAPSFKDYGSKHYDKGQTGCVEGLTNVPGGGFTRQEPYADTDKDGD